MASIHILPKLVAERIAAGEVVERPASVVKELIENAIDAGATAIAVEVREGGLALIRVSDNGAGMSPADAPLAVERFATSKIASEQDLLRVKTLGFRGEALPSIAAMSLLEVVTRSRDAIEGTRVRVVEGQAQSEVTGAPIGTQVLARNLFYNAPARRKFLKSPFRETELIRKTIMQYALAYPQTAFKLTVDGRDAFAWAAATPLERIGDVWGRDTATEMMPIEFTSLDLRVRGHISRPTLARGSREWQMFYVNGRPIRSGLLAVMLERPYAGRLPPNRHALAVIQIEVDPQQVDVNAHPRKVEVRFYQERAIYQAVMHAVGEALREFPITYTEDGTDWSFANPLAGSAPPMGWGALREQGSEYTVGGWHALGQIHNTYILAQANNGLVIVDQHSAQEQVFFERLTSGEGGPMRKTGGATIAVMPGEARLLSDHLEEYQALGIELEPFGANTFRLGQMPAFIGLPPVELLTALLAEHERHQTLAGDALRDVLASKAACLSAIKAGDMLALPEQQALLDNLARIYSPATCPHGRPTFVTVSMAELEQRFVRR
jgi:DNA mismatch repair protein MutL